MNQNPRARTPNGTAYAVRGGGCCVGGVVRDVNNDDALTAVYKCLQKRDDDDDTNSTSYRADVCHHYYSARGRKFRHGDSETPAKDNDDLPHVERIAPRPMKTVRGWSLNTATAEERGWLTVFRPGLLLLMLFYANNI